MLLRLRASESLRVGGSLPVVGRVPYQADQKIRDLGLLDLDVIQWIVRAVRGWAIGQQLI